MVWKWVGVRLFACDAVCELMGKDCVCVFLLWFCCSLLLAAAETTEPSDGKFVLSCMFFVS